MEIINKETPKAGYMEVELSVVAQEIQDKYQKELKKYARNVSLKGFRKGKAPLKVVEGFYGDYLLASAKEEAANAAVNEFLKDYDYVGNPDVDMDEKDETLQVKLSFKFWPRIEDAKDVIENLDYTPEDPKDVEDIDVQNYFYSRVVSAAKSKDLDKIKDGTADFGDMVKYDIRLKGAKSGKVISENISDIVIPETDEAVKSLFAEREDSQDDELYYQIVQGLIGKKAGEAAQVPFKIDEKMKTGDFNEEWIVEVEIDNVKSISAEDRKAVEDEMIPEGKTKEEFLESMKGLLGYERTREMQQKISTDVNKKLVELYRDKLEFNEDLYQDEFKNQMNKYIEGIAKQYYDSKPLILKDFANQDQIEEEVKKSTVAYLVDSVIVNAISRDYEMKVSKKEFDYFSNQQCHQYGLELREYKKIVKEHGLQNQIYWQILVSKINGFLASKFMPKPEAPAEEDAKPKAKKKPAKKAAAKKPAAKKPAKKTEKVKKAEKKEEPAPDQEEKKESE